MANTPATPSAVTSNTLRPVRSDACPMTGCSNEPITTITANATPVSTVGDIAIGGNGQLQSAAPLRSFQSPFLDPYGSKGRNLSTQGLMPSACTFNSLHLGDDTPLDPGRYCDGLKISGADVTFSAGTYIIDGGDFDVSGTSTLIGDGVTFVLTGSGNDYATV